ncbi:hypothetical protein NN561_012344 [Cricetulus griseus]
MAALALDQGEGRGLLPRPRHRGPGPLQTAPPPWAGPGRLRSPQGAQGPERPLAGGPARPAPFPPLSRFPPPPAWVILRLRALRGRNPETPSSTSLPLALLLLPLAPSALSRFVALSRFSRRTLRGAATPPFPPWYWQVWAPAPTPCASRLAQLSGLLLKRCLLSQDWF